MKKIFFLGVFLAFVCSGLFAQNLQINTYGTFYTIDMNGVNVSFGTPGTLVVTKNSYDTTKVSITARNFDIYSISVSSITFNSVIPTSYSNLMQLIGAVFPAGGSGGGGGGGLVNGIVGNIVTALGGGIFSVQQVQTDWNAASGLGSILNKPNIQILDSNQFVKYRDSNILSNKGYITPAFFFANRGSGGSGNTRWGNFGLAGYQVVKINDSSYIVNRDPTIVADSLRINSKIDSLAISSDSTVLYTFRNRVLFQTIYLKKGSSGGGGGSTDTTSLSNRINLKLDISRFLRDSIRWDTAISNRVIGAVSDTILSTLTLLKTNGNNSVLQLKKGSGSSGNISGTGTAGTFPIFTGVNTIGNSVFSLVGGILTYLNYFKIGSNDDNTNLGFLAGNSNTSANGNTFIGSTAGYSNTQGNYNVYLGYGAGYSNTIGRGNVVIGGTNYSLPSPTQNSTLAIVTVSPVGADQLKIYSDATHKISFPAGYSGTRSVLAHDQNGMLFDTALISGGTIDTTSLSNRINNKLDITRFLIDSIKFDTAIGNRYISATNDTTANTLTLLKTNGNNTILQLKKGSGSSGNNIDTTSLSNRINTKLDISRFAADSIKRDTSIGNRVIGATSDTINQRITLLKTNGNNIVVQLKTLSKSGISPDSVVYNNPYPYQDTVKIISTTDKVIQIGTNNKPVIDIGDGYKVLLISNNPNNVNPASYNSKFVRRNNTYYGSADSNLLSSANGITFTNLRSAQSLTANPSYNLISALEYDNDTLIVMCTNSTVGQYFILVKFNVITQTVISRSAIINLTNLSGQGVREVYRVIIFQNKLYCTPPAGFDNYLFQIDLTLETVAKITTIASPVALFKTATTLYFLDRSGYYNSVINSVPSRIAQISTNSVTDATIFQDRYACVADYTGDVFVYDIVDRRQIDFIQDVYFGGSEVSVSATTSGIYLVEGTATQQYSLLYSIVLGDVTVTINAPLILTSSLLDSNLSDGSDGQVLTSFRGKPVWTTITLPLVSKFTFTSPSSGGNTNPQLFYSTIDQIGLQLNGTGVVLTPGTYQIIFKASFPAIDQVVPGQFAFYKFGLTTSIDGNAQTLNEIRSTIDKGTSAYAASDNMSTNASDYIVIGANTTYYMTTYINRNFNAGMSGIITVVKLK